MRIAAFVQQMLVVIGFEEGRVTLTEMVDQLVADDTQIGEDPDPNGRGGDNKTTGVGGVVSLGKGGNRQFADGNGLAGIETPDELRFEGKRELLPGAVADVDRELVAFGQNFQTTDMVVMFMGNKDRFYGGQGQAQASHPPFGFPAGDSGVDQHRFPVVSDIITISVAAGVE
jgi:hypothetical protein